MAETEKKRGEASREAILEAAEIVFAEHGFDGARVDTIAHLSGYDKKLLFRYYGDKLGLYAEILKRADQEAHALLTTVFAPLLSDEIAVLQAVSWRHFLTSMVQTLFDYLLDHQRFLRILTWEMAEGWQTFKQIAARFPPEHIDQFEMLFQKARSVGLLRSDFMPTIQFTMMLSWCQIYLGYLPLYQQLFPNEELASASGLKHAREYLVDFVVAGMMNCLKETDIGYIHHVGHVVHDIEAARELYRRLGFLCTAPAYPTLSRKAGEPATPFGAANMHVTFARNFVEVMAIVTEESHLPDDASPIPLRVPPAALSQVVASIEQTISNISASLARFEGLHILVFQTNDAQASARRFDQSRVGHSGVNRVQQPHQRVPMGIVEIDKEDVPEGRLAVAEAPILETSQAQAAPTHPNGAIDLVESMLCVPDAQIEAYVARYQRYLAHVARKDGAAYVFDLKQSSVRLIPASRLGETMPGETAPALPAFTAYTVAVRDLDATRRWLENNGFTVNTEPGGGIFVPARAALGAAIIFRQAR